MRLKQQLRCIFTSSENKTMKNIALLLMRVMASVILLIHGIDKIINFEILSTTFPDPVGIGSTVTLVLAIFVEVVCASFVIIGFYSRINCLPIMFGLALSIFSIHGADSFFQKELTILLLGLFMTSFLAGPGDFSIDTQITECFHLED